MQTHLERLRELKQPEEAGEMLVDALALLEQQGAGEDILGTPSREIAKATVLNNLGYHHRHVKQLEDVSGVPHFCIILRRHVSMSLYTWVQHIHQHPQPPKPHIPVLSVLLIDHLCVLPHRNAHTRAAAHILCTNRSFFSKAAALYIRALDIRVPRLGKVHHDTIATRHNLAEVLLLMGKDDAAHEVQQGILHDLGALDNSSRSD